MRRLVFTGMIVAACFGIFTAGIAAEVRAAAMRTSGAVIAVLSDTSVTPRSPAAPSDPHTLGELLKAAGYEVRYLDRSVLADPVDFNSETVDLLVLPYGPAFPPEAVENLKRFLKAGGKLLTTGGYAFDDLPDPLNSRSGKAADLLEIPADRIAMFDAGYRLEHVAYARAAPDQYVIDPETEIRASLQGYAAVGMFGNNDPVFALPTARWIPILAAYDEYGRPRGTVGAIAHNFAGPYAGSSWAFFGVTSHDLFAWPQMQRALPGIVENLLRSTFLNGLQTGYASYRDGEEVLASVQVRNCGQGPQSVVVRLRIYPAGDEAEAMPAAEHTEEVEVPAGSFRFVSARWAPVHFDHDLYRVRADLFAKDSGRQIDGMEVGFTVWREATITSGPRIRFRDNFFQVNGTPKLQFATKSPGFLFSSPLEEPLRWYREMVRMRDMGLDQFEVIHVSPFAQDLEDPDEKLLRKLDALVVLAQKVGIGIKFSVFDWVDVAPGTEELEKQASWARYLASRYSSVPGIIFDLQGDIPLNLEGPEIRRLWNEFLTQKYGSPGGRAAAWGETLELATVEVDLPQTVHMANRVNTWPDRREADLAEFRTWLFVRWSNALRQAIKAVNPDVPVGAEFYSPLSGGTNVDQRSGSAVLDFTGIGYYGPLAEYPEALALTDLRVSGKSLGINEFGVKTHPAWTGQPTWHEAQEAVDYFLGFVHSTFGAGASVVLSWDWKDMMEAIFPWGLNYPGDLVPKDIGHAYRNLALLFHSFSPKYEPSEVYVVIPSELRKGDPSWYATITGIARASIRRLQQLHVAFGVIDESELGQLPRTAKLLIYPCPWVVSDDTLALLERFVEDGGTLYISGNLAYNPDRRQQYPDRLARLARIKVIAERYAPLAATTAPSIKATPSAAGRALGLTQSLTAYPALELALLGATALMVDPEGHPITTLYEKGRGKVVFTSDPVEFIQRPAILSKAVDELYQLLLRLAKVRPIPVTGTGPGLDVYLLSTQSRHQVFVLVNRGERDYNRVVIHPETTIAHRLGTTSPISLSVASGKTGLAIIDPEGRLVAVESTGDVYVGDRRVVGIDGHAAVISLDGSALSESEELLLVPFLPGEIRLMGAVTTQWGDLKGGSWHTFRYEGDLTERTNGLVETVVQVRAGDALRTLALMARNGKEQEVIWRFNRYVESGVLWP